MARYTHKQILETYISSNFNKSKTAVKLNMSRHGLYMRINNNPELKRMLIDAEEKASHWRLFMSMILMRLLRHLKENIYRMVHNEVKRIFK